jgi:hypothetical protein
MLTAGESKAALQLVTAAAVSAAATALGRVSGPPEEQRAVLLEVVPGVISYYSDGSSALAADFYDDERERAAPPKLYLAEPVILDRTVKIRNAVAWASQPLFEGDIEKSASRLADVVQLETARPYRDTILTNRRRDPSAVGWRRISSGGCRLCRMLAARGAVYKESTARFATHPSCKCSAQPVFSTNDYGEEASAMQYLASKAKRTPAQRERLRQYLDVHYPSGGAPKVAQGSAKLKNANEVTPDQKATRLQAQLTSLETSLAGLKTRAASGESVAKPLKWQEDRIAAIRRELRAK